MERERWSRRRFIFAVSKGAAASFLFLPAVGCIERKSKTQPAGESTLLLLDLRKPECRALAEIGGSLKVQNPLDQKHGIIIVRVSESEAVAYSSKCAHRGCELPPPENGAITCPCHGAQYDMWGRVTHGPAGKNLDQYATSIVDGIITIQKAG